MAIKYIDGKRLCNALDAGLSKVLAGEEYLNKINVFPVPDGGTGTNLAYTLTAVRAGLSRRPLTDLTEASRGLADAALNGARGNSGAILAQFLIGFAEAVEDCRRLSTRQFSRAVEAASRHAYQALPEPREGTLLSVIRDWTGEVAEQSTQLNDFKMLLGLSLERVRLSLEATPGQLRC